MQDLSPVREQLKKPDFESTHRENKARVNLGCSHLFLLAQVQKQFVLKKRRTIRTKSPSNNLKQVTKFNTDLFSRVAAEHGSSQLALLRVLTVGAS